MAGELRRVVGVVVRLAPSAAEGPPQWHAAQTATCRSQEFWGTGLIEGRVTVEGAPAQRRVRLFDARTALLVAETWSRPDGQYRFYQLSLGHDYIVVAHDHQGRFNAVIADRISPVLPAG